MSWMMLTLGTVDDALLKTGMKEDFSGELNHDCLKKIRQMVDKDMAKERNKECFKKWQAQCDFEEFKIPGGDGQDMIVEVITPKSLKG